MASQRARLELGSLDPVASAKVVQEPIEETGAERLADAYECARGLPTERLDDLGGIPSVAALIDEYGER